MKLTEAQLRSVVRKELQAILKEMHGEPESGSEEKNIIPIAAGVAALAGAPAALRAYLEQNPEAMAWVIEAMKQGFGFE